MCREQSLFFQTGLVLEAFPEENEIHTIFVTMKRKISRPEIQHYDVQKSHQGVGFKINHPPEGQGYFRPSISQGPYKCELGCGLLSFNFHKDLRRHINDHETRTYYRCPIDGYKYGGVIVGYFIKCKDNFRRHLQNTHKMDNTEIVSINLERFLVMV